MDTEKCLLYPLLQKFYNSLSYLVTINPNNYIFENIPKIDAFFQEFRNITFAMQRQFNTPELKQFYESKRKEYLLNDKMRWFVDTRNTVTKEHPFKLEKAISLKIYTAENDFDEFGTLLTIDRDKNMSELLEEVNGILDKYYKNWFEVFFSIFILLIENGKEVDIFDQIIYGIKTMWEFISDISKSYPCNCKKCDTLMKKIIICINKIQIDLQMIFLQDCYYYKGVIQIGSRINGHGMNEGVYDKNILRFSLATSPGFGEDVCKDDLLLLKRWAANHMMILAINKEKSNKEPEILATFCLVFEDNTAELTEMFGGTLKTTYLRMVNNIADRVRTEKIRAVLYVCETIFYSSEHYLEALTIPANKRQQKSQGTFLYNLIVSKKLDKIMGIGIDYSKLGNKEYLINQLNKPEEMPDNFLLYPIFKAMKDLGKNDSTEA
jgi:hypothetical protein